MNEIAQRIACDLLGRHNPVARQKHIGFSVEFYACCGLVRVPFGGGIFVETTLKGTHQEISDAYHAEIKRRWGHA